MYYFWKTKGMLPSVYNELPYGEHKILKVFYEMEIKEEPRGHNTCPLLGGK